jgi:hypothetical protein
MPTSEGQQTVLITGATSHAARSAGNRSTPPSIPKTTAAKSENVLTLAAPEMSWPPGTKTKLRHH